MLSEAIAILEKLPARIIQARLMKRRDTSQYVYTILAKTADGRVPTFQLIGNQLIKYEFKDPVNMSGQYEKVIHTFSTEK